MHSAGGGNRGARRNYRWRCRVQGEKEQGPIPCRCNPEEKASPAKTWWEEGETESYLRRPVRDLKRPGEHNGGERGKKVFPSINPALLKKGGGEEY